MFLDIFFYFINYLVDFFHTELEALELNNKSNCSSRRSSLKDEDSLFPHKCMCKKNKSKNSKTLEEILGIQPESGLFESEAVTRVYRAEIPPLPQPPTLPPPSLSTSSPTTTTTTSSQSPASCEVDRDLIEAKINNNQQQQTEVTEQPMMPLSKSDLLLGAIIRTCERNLDKNPTPTTPVGPRLRSLSENVKQDLKKHLEPLDMSFDTTRSSKDSSEDEEEEDEEDLEEDDRDVGGHLTNSRRSSFSSDGHVIPTPDECASFRQSFDSATSMVI